MPRPGPQLTQPNVHDVAQANLDFVQRGAVPQASVIGPQFGGGSPNEKALLQVARFFADPHGQRGAMIAMLAGQERNGFLTVGDGCEQGIGTPHIELWLNAMACLFLYAVRQHDAELIGYGKRWFQGLYAMGLATMTPHGQVLWPGARQSELGPDSKVQDACVGVVGGRVTSFTFHLYPDTCSVWALLAALALDRTLFDEARTWTRQTAHQHFPKLRWPLKTVDFADGQRTTIEVPPGDTKQMGRVGSAGVGTVEVDVQHSTGKVSWLTYGPPGVAQRLGTLVSESDLGPPRS